MKDPNVQGVLTMESSGNGGNGRDPRIPAVEVDPPSTVAGQAKAPEAGWLIRNSSELVSICAVVVLLILAFGALSAFNGGTPLWDSNSSRFLPLVVIVTIAVIGILLFAGLAVKGERIVRDATPHVLSASRVETLKAAGLPRDLRRRLREILEAAELDPSLRAGLTVVGRERVDGSWISDLESTFGKSRVAEFEEMLFKYTAD